MTNNKLTRKPLNILCYNIRSTNSCEHLAAFVILQNNKFLDYKRIKYIENLVDKPQTIEIHSDSRELHKYTHYTVEKNSSAINEWKRSVVM